MSPSPGSPSTPAKATTHSSSNADFSHPTSLRSSPEEQLFFSVVGGFGNGNRPVRPYPALQFTPVIPWRKPGNPLKARPVANVYLTFVKFCDSRDSELPQKLEGHIQHNNNIP